MKKMTVREVYSRIKTFLPVICFGGLLWSCSAPKQTLETKSLYKGFSHHGTHSRALTVVDDLALFAGKGGYVTFFNLVTYNVGTKQIPEIEDFRDIHYTQQHMCYLMNSGERGVIWGVTPWGSPIKLFDTADVFLDGMAFWNDSVGIVYGDPVNGDFFVAKTVDAGNTWNTINTSNIPHALENEGGFAASGTGIQTIGENTVYFGTGLGFTARLFCSYDQGSTWKVKDTPLRSGGTFGIYSMYFWSEKEGVIMGGSYVDSTYNKDICQYTTNGGDTWENRSNGLPGYCSCVHGTEDGSLLVATGRSGTYYSLTKGNDWTLLGKAPYYSCFVTPSKIVLSGKNGTFEFFEYTVKEGKPKK